MSFKVIFRGIIFAYEPKKVQNSQIFVSVNIFTFKL